MPWIKKGILSGVDKIIFGKLDGKAIGQPPHYDKSSFCLSLKDPSLGNLCGFDLIKGIYDQIVINWDKSGRPPSEKNWRWEKKPTKQKRNKSPEVGLEKALVKISPSIWPEVKNWSNQVPTSSGLLGPSTDKRRAIDLVHRWKNGEEIRYEFVELKVASNNPVSAAMEILVYGMLFVFSREHRDDLNYIRELNPLLWGREIRLAVLAPDVYYEKCNLERLEETIKKGLRKFLSDRNVQLDFEFQKFPQSFDPRCVLKINNLKSRNRLIIDAFRQRQPVYEKHV